MIRIGLAGILFLLVISTPLYAGSDTTEWTVKVFKANHLRDKDWGIFFRNPDAYVIVSYRADSRSPWKTIGQTKVCKNYENPVWNAAFKVAVKIDWDKRDGAFKFCLMDKDLCNDDLSGMIQAKAKPMSKQETKYFKQKPADTKIAASLTIQIIAPEKPEPPQPPKDKKGVWSIAVVDGKYLTTLKSADTKGALYLVVGYRIPQKPFSEAGKIKISKSDTVTKDAVSSKGIDAGTLSFLLSDREKPGQNDFEKGALLDAEDGEYHVKIPDTKKGYIEVVLKFTLSK